MISERIPVLKYRNRIIENKNRYYRLRRMIKKKEEDINKDLKNKNYNLNQQFTELSELESEKFIRYTVVINNLNYIMHKNYIK